MMIEYIDFLYKIRKFYCIVLEIVDFLLFV